MKEEVIMSYNSLLGERSQTISFSSMEEKFEVLGYLASPGRINTIEAEVTKDGRDEIFESMFPNQVYRPIELGYTPSGLKNKLSPQFRVNLLNMRNCPDVLVRNVGKGNGSCVARINKSRFVIEMVQDYGFRFGGRQDVSAIKEIAVRAGHGSDFDRGYSL